MAAQHTVCAAIFLKPSKVQCLLPRARKKTCDQCDRCYVSWVQSGLSFLREIAGRDLPKDLMLKQFKMNFADKPKIFKQEYIFLNNVNFTY
jgi:hypothetical protein